jgi:hypothetical protein
VAVRQNLCEECLQKLTNDPDSAQPSFCEKRKHFYQINNRKLKIYTYTNLDQCPKEEAPGIPCSIREKGADPTCVSRTIPISSFRRVTTESIQSISQPVERNSDRESYGGFLWVSVLPTLYVLHHSFSNNILLTKPDTCTFKGCQKEARPEKGFDFCEDRKYSGRHNHFFKPTSHQTNIRK